MSSSRPQPSLRRRAVRDGLSVAGILCLLYTFLVAGPHPILGVDALSYWRVDLDDVYVGHLGDVGWFPYTPAAAQVAAVFDLLPWPVFLAAWLGLLTACLVWLGRHWTLALLAFPPVVFEMHQGNINLLIATAIVIGMRYPGAWAFVLLTKTTPGIGLIWFLVRREWRALAIALGVTAGLAGVSLLTAPDVWAAWLSEVPVSSGYELRLGLGGSTVPVPGLPIRLALAAVIVAWGARTDRPWTVPLGATLAMPVLWITVLTVLVAMVPLVRERSRAADAQDHRPLHWRALFLTRQPQVDT